MTCSSQRYPVSRIALETGRKSYGAAGTPSSSLCDLGVLE